MKSLYTTLVILIALLAIIYILSISLDLDREEVKIATISKYDIEEINYKGHSYLIIKVKDSIRIVGFIHAPHCCTGTE